MWPSSDRCPGGSWWWRIAGRPHNTRATARAAGTALSDVTRDQKITGQARDAFQELIRRFPDSEYVPDARQRMVYLRNRLADYENHVADYYIRRGAYVAATMYKSDDFLPYLYRTGDYGATWTRIDSGIDPMHFTRAVRADPTLDDITRQLGEIETLIDDAADQLRT